MAPIEVKCWECGKSFKVKPEFAGKKGKCAVCGKVIQIPDPSAKVEHAYDINVDIHADDVKKVARQIAAGPGVSQKKRKGFLGKIFGKK